MEIEWEWRGRLELKAVSADGCRSLSECQWKAARLGGKSRGIMFHQTKGWDREQQSITWDTIIASTFRSHGHCLQLQLQPSSPDRGGESGALWGTTWKEWQAHAEVPFHIQSICVHFSFVNPDLLPNVYFSSNAATIGTTKVIVACLPCCFYN